jgi:hypothetical protein
VALKPNIKTKAVMHGDTAHFQFQVQGPKGGAYVELYGRSRPFKEITQEDASEFYILP